MKLENGLLDPCEPLLVVGRRQNAFDSDAELLRFAASISTNGSDDGVFDVKAFCCLLSR